MTERPSGTVTFLFSDIEGSTQRWEKQGEQMQRAFDRQETIMRQAIAVHSGYAYKMIGDAFQAAFATAPAALSAALHAQRALHAEAWGDVGPLRVRMALHTGITHERGDDYVGPLLNRVARLLSTAHGGQILLSHATQVLVHDQLPSGASLRDLGEYRLKDLVRPEHIFQLLVPDLPSDFPPLKTLDAPIVPLVVAPAVGEELPAPGESPFKGLQYFDEADADIFFGRERLTAKLVEHLNAHPLLVVVGASGSGKSSLVRAGLIPALRSNDLNRYYQIHIITPTNHPLESLALSLTRDSDSIDATTKLMDSLARDPRSLHLWLRKQRSNDLNRYYVLVVDQFEELFTLCRDEEERKAFVDNLLTAVGAPSPVVSSPASGGGRVGVSTGEGWGEGSTIAVITLRADFYAHCSPYANLCEALEKFQAYIVPMNEEEMRRAIEEPAKRDSWTIESGLVDLLLQDVGDEPGALPLLSHALLETWQRRRGRTMTFAGYNASGGVRGAIAKTAESVYQKSSPEQQAIARNIFLRLTELGEGTQDTRRRAALSELIPPFADARAADEVLKLLADARLITTSEGYAEVAHEALIREWPTLREWLNENREGLRLHRHLTESAQAWQKLNRDPGELYRGARLVHALEWAEENSGELNPLEQEFLDASKEMLEREEAEREAQRQRELQAAQKLAEAERRRANILRWAVMGSTLLLVVMIGLAVFAFSQRAAAENAQVEAVSQRDAAEKAKADSEYQRQVAFARELAGSALNNLDIDPERSILLALQAVSVSTAGGTPVVHEAEEALHRAVMTSRVRMTLRGHSSSVWDARFSPDGKLVATASADRSAKIWDAATGKELLTLSATATVARIAFSPDAKRLATISTDWSAKVWDLATGTVSLTLQDKKEVSALGYVGVAYSPDGTRIAAADSDNTVKIWDATTGKLLLTLSGHTRKINDIAFSPDGKRLATASGDRTVKIWDVEIGNELLTRSHTSGVRSVAFSPDGKRLATAAGEFAKVWDAASGRELVTLRVRGANVWGVTFDLPLGTRLITGDSDSAQVWDISSTLNLSADSNQVATSASGQLLFTLAGHLNSVGGVSVSPDGKMLVTGSDDSTVRIWDISDSGASEWLTVSDACCGAWYTPDGKRLVTPNSTGTKIKVLDAITGQLLLTIDIGGEINGGNIGWDGKRFVTITADKRARVWDLETGRQLLNVPTANVDDNNNYFYGAALSPDGTRVATATGKGNITIWDVNLGKELMTLTGHTTGVNAIDYSPDGTRIASADRDIKVWDAMSGKELLTLQRSVLPRGFFLGVTFSPDGTRIAAVNFFAFATVWDAATGQELQTLVGHTSVPYGVSFSPDGTRLVTSGEDSTLKIWNVSPGVRPGEQPLTLYGQGGYIARPGFSPDGKRVAAGWYVRGGGNVTRVFALALEDIIAIAKSRVTRALTTDECQKFLHVEVCPAGN